MELNYSVENFESYTFDKWYNILKNKTIKNINNKIYNFIKKSILIEFSKQDINYFIKNNKFTNELKNNILNTLEIEKSYFFKLSNKSPKDILENDPILQINEDEHRSIKLEKKIKQLNILKVNSIEKIEYLLNNSKRTIEDMELFSNYSGKSKLYLVFQDWSPNLGKSIEFRCFIINNKLVGICLFKPEYYSSRTVIPVEIIQFFINQIIQYLECLNLKKYVIDCFIYNDNIYDVHLIEINPFDEYTDTFSFEYDDIINTKTLLITI